MFLPLSIKTLRRASLSCKFYSRVGNVVTFSYEMSIVLIISKDIKSIVENNKNKIPREPTNIRTSSTNRHIHLVADDINCKAGERHV